VKHLLVVSNGYGEDLEAAQIIKMLPPGRVAVSAYPLVGIGRAYPAGVSLLEPRRDFPSGGFSARGGFRNLFVDVAHGWLGFWRAQRRTLGAQRGGIDLVLAAGDPYCLMMAAAAGGPTVYLELPHSDYIGSHPPLDLRIIKRYACQVFSRDEVTAAALRRSEIPARCVGFTLMDSLSPTGETFGLPVDRDVLTVLPGSKPPAFTNLMLLLRAASAAVRNGASAAILIAWPPNLSSDRLRAVIESAGGRWLDDRHIVLDGMEITVTADHFADALARATVVLGMAGAAHEQAAGLGKPVVAFPGSGPQFTPRFLSEQRRLLGDALVAVSTPEEAGRAVALLLRDSAERARRGAIGRERQGAPGGSLAIASFLIERMNG
jgi:uncharacterized protein (TIGR03492 family)